MKKNTLPKRPKNAHKGMCGRVGVIAGSLSMLGAAILTARAALRTGAGLVYLITAPEALAHINIVYPEIIVLPFGDYKQITRYLTDYKINSLAIGPGLGRTEKTQKLTRKIIFEYCVAHKLKTVIDADALFAISKNKLETLSETQFVLTPHKKEYEQLFGPQEPQDVALATKQVVLCKGPNTIVCDPQNKYINKTGNEGMATAGAGDVLTGMIAALVGQGSSVYDAAVLGAYLHGLAGDFAKQEKGIYSLIASDIIENIFQAITKINNEDTKG
jgi:hydroxyethylthiazole kinase-like uncharacterized protein yjeF